MNHSRNVIELAPCRARSRRHELRFVGDGAQLLGTHVYVDEEGGVLTPLDSVDPLTIGRSFREAMYGRFVLAVDKPHPRLEDLVAQLLYRLEHRFGGQLINGLKCTGC